jgi:hypothetical protein
LLYFLLGRETYAKNYKDSCKYSDFGGVAKNNETSEECAAREFFEETLNAVPVFLQENDQRPAVPVRNSAHMARLLKSNTHYARVNFEFVKAKHVCVYTTFLVQVQWMPEVLDRYEYLAQLQQTRVEKDRIAYMSAPMVLGAITNIRSLQFPTMNPRTFFKNRFRPLFKQCFKDDYDFMQKNMLRSIPERTIKSLSPNKKSSWSRGQTLDSKPVPRTLSFRTYLNHGARNPGGPEECRGVGGGDSARPGRSRWEGKDPQDPGRFENRRPVAAAHSK